MKKIIRSILPTDPAEQAAATENLKNGVTSTRLTGMNKAEAEVMEFVTDFYQRRGEAPQFHNVLDHFEKAQNAEAVVLLEEAKAETPTTGGSFLDLFETEVETQAARQFTEMAKTAIKIATQGIKVKGSTIKGTDEAVAYVFSEAKTKPSSGEGRMPASMKASSAELTKLYNDRKANPHQTYGILTGYGLFDSSTAGIRKKQLYLHAGFGGHLKSTHMLNMIVNAAVDGGWNPLLFSSEMPAEELKLLMIAIHSANPKFGAVGRPLPAFRLLLGAMRQEEEDFFELVKDDLINNPSHGSIRVIDSGEFTTFSSVCQRTVQEHAKEEVDELWVDYITRLPLDAKYRGMPVVEGVNQTIADAKRFAMAFDRGAGLAVCSPFQINREGYKKAKTSEGRMDKTHLAQFNAAEREADVITYIYFDAEEQATSEPKIGLMKSRWGQVKSDPVNVFIEPDSRRIMDLSAGMTAAAGYAPTKTGGAGEEEVVL